MSKIGILPVRDKSLNEPELIARYMEADMSAGVLVDVGAHHGGVCLPFLRRGWRALAFEPDRQNRKVLEGVVCKLPSLRIDPRAVSEASRRDVPFFRSAISDGISSLTAFDQSHVPAETVDTVTLAEALAEHGIEQVDFLKIDVEGHDLPALRGFPWGRIRPEVILCEFEDRKTLALGYTFHDEARYLRAQGYEVLVSEWCPIEAYGREHVWRRFAVYPCELIDPNAWGNLIAFRDGIDWGRWCTAAAAVPAEDVSRWRRRAENRRREAVQLDAMKLSLEKDLADLRASGSWRVTAPMRSFAALLRRWASCGNKRGESGGRE